MASPYIPLFDVFFHSIFVHLAFYVYRIISLGEINIDDIPGSFVLIWLLVHTVRRHHEKSRPVQVATSTPEGFAFTKTSPGSAIFFFYIFLLEYGNKAILRLFQFNVFPERLKKKRKREKRCLFSGLITICLSPVAWSICTLLLISILGYWCFSYKFQGALRL